MKELMNSYTFKLYENEQTNETTYEVFKKTGEPVESFHDVTEAVKYIHIQERDKHKELTQF
jgi:hypothetical protein